MSGDDFTRALLAAGKREVADGEAKDRALAKVQAAVSVGAEGAKAAKGAESVPLVASARPAAFGAGGEGAAVIVIPRRGLHMVAKVALALASALTFVLVGGGMYISRQNDERRAAAGLAASQLADSQKQLDELNAQLAQQNQEVETATAALANAKDESAKAAAQAQLAAAETAVASTKKAFGAVRAGTAKATTKQACTCNKMDPLCGCIQ